jgi:hypothetical protein
MTASPVRSSSSSIGSRRRSAGPDNLCTSRASILSARPCRPADAGRRAGPVRPGGQAPAAGGEAGQGSGPDQRDGEAAAADEPLPVLPDPVPRDGERALARWGLLGEGAEPVFAPGVRYPLANNYAVEQLPLTGMSGSIPGL